MLTLSRNIMIKGCLLAFAVASAVTLAGCPEELRLGSASGGQRCHGAYGGQCLPYVADLDCKDIVGTVRVGSSDPYRLDADNDGIGCE